MSPTEANVAAPFGKVNPSDQFSTWIENGDAIKAWDGADFRGSQLKSYFWDGVTDYTKPAPGTEDAVDREEKSRIDGFGDWLEDQGDLPPELQLRVES